MAVLSACAFAADAPMMDNWAVYKAFKSGAAVETIISAIGGSTPRFDLREAEVAKLTNNGVPQSVLDAMSVRQLAPKDDRAPSATPAVIPSNTLPTRSNSMPLPAATPMPSARPTLTRTFHAELIGEKDRKGGSLVVAPDRLTFRDLEIPVAQVSNVVYERASKPRYAVGILLAWPLLFTKSKQHFLTVQHGDYSVFKLEKGDYRQVIAAVEAATGRKAERHEER